MNNYWYTKIFATKDLTSMEKLIMIYILTNNGELTNENCYVILTNQEISNNLNCSISCVSKVITSLIKKGYLEYYKFTGKNRVLKILLHSK